MNFKAGDVVRLKSGGPEMTIVRKSDKTGEEESYVCTWFDKGQPQYNTFPAATLEKDEPGEGGGGIYIQ